MSGGDARSSLNILELAVSLSRAKLSKKSPVRVGVHSEEDHTPTKGQSESGSACEVVTITLEDIQRAAQRSQHYHDKRGDSHFSLISALHKSMRSAFLVEMPCIFFIPSEARMSMRHYTISVECL